MNPLILVVAVFGKNILLLTPIHWLDELMKEFLIKDHFWEVES